MDLRLNLIKRGGVGIISVTANLAPKLCSDFQKYSKSKSDNEIKEAERIDQMLQPLHKSLFIESNPAPTKYAAKLLGLCNDEIRLPLVKIKKETEIEVKKALSIAKINLNDKKTNSGLKIICINRKASFNYFLQELIEAGLVLKGSEIKSIRSGKINIAESYAVEKNGEIILSKFSYTYI